MCQNKEMGHPKLLHELHGFANDREVANHTSHKPRTQGGKATDLYDLAAICWGVMSAMSPLVVIIR